MTTQQSPGPYPKNGLIGWFDGIWNIGVEQHSNNTIVWKNLGSGGSIYDATYMDGTVNWSDDSHNFVYSSGKCFLMQDSGILVDHFDISSGGYSVQVVCMPTYQRTFSGMVGNEHRNGTYPLVFGQFQGANRLFMLAGGRFEGAFVSINQIHTYTLIANVSDKTLTLYRDKELINQAAATFNAPTASADVQMAIGRGNCETSLTNRNFQGKIYCVRFYDRALSPEEINATTTTDGNRFGF